MDFFVVWLLPLETLQQETYLLYMKVGYKFWGQIFIISRSIMIVLSIDNDYDGTIKIVFSYMINSYCASQNCN